MKDKKILLVEDDENISKIIKLYLEKEGFVVSCCYDGIVACETFLKNKYDLVLLDLMLPGLDGYQVCQKIRETSYTPIIMLTAKGDLEEKVKGLHIGADDYVTKPFEIHELLARIHAMLRRIEQDHEEVNRKEGNRLEYDNLIFDIDAFIIYLNEDIINVPRREAQLLKYLMMYPNQVFKREELIEGIWGWDFEGEDRVIDLYIKRLRKRLKSKTKQSWSIKTVWGIGYKFEVEKSV
ncbi:two component transcriptional regulator, winged helix family [Alkaliphilus metalliredigens QYMF]|uniref:Stage 0 sporulation protein A homolog n=1 Tax=Alkaliphilus metalliredigens (strain QYMF) TaxID=293826 RepID=A6TKQ5_ALKMQ|nr:response regulator transcription factor [Alkaliphilus metalliredigens]ABR46773.1 two component transcriptional regulator, winged helix family [Alkaliphilus metalliredigens QYMF]